MRPRARATTGVLICLALLAPGDASAAAARVSNNSLPWLHVEQRPGARPEIVDSNSRTVILRGVNVTGLEDDAYTLTKGGNWSKPFWPTDPAAYRRRCPRNSHLIVDPPLCEVDAGRGRYAQSADPDSHNDFAQMRALGFNLVRLTLSWSLLEPEPGAYDRAYLDRIAQVVGWAEEQGMYVLLDMHQDNYSRFMPPDDAPEAAPLATKVPCEGHHCDGAPAWAVLTDGEPGLALLGQAPFDAKVAAAFTSFWLNRTVPAPQGDAPGTGLQDHYIGAMAALARRFRDNSTVVGYEIMNEPLPGYIPFPGPFDQGYLYPFYRRVIDAITGVGDGAPCPASTPALAACGYPDLGIHDTKHLFFFEPMAARNLVDVSPQMTAPFSSYPNLVYAPHVYSYVFTLPGLPLSEDQAFQTADAEARAMGAALLIGEYGNGPPDDDPLLANATAAQDRHAVSSTVWAWKANCTGTGRTCTNWATYYGDTRDPPAQNLDIIPTRRKYLSRAYPRAVAGTLLAFAYDPAGKTFSMSATADEAVKPGRVNDETIVYIPASVAGPVGVSGNAVLDRVDEAPDGSRLAYVAPTGRGGYRFLVRADRNAASGGITR